MTAKKVYATREDYLEAKRKRNMVYNQENTKRYAISLNTTTDADIISWLDTFDNKQGYIKELIREDMERRKDHNATEKI